MWKNGSAEARAPIMHNGVYGSYGFDGDEEDYGNLCPDYIIGPGTGVSAWMFGSRSGWRLLGREILLDRVLENYGGSVYLIQGCMIGTLTHTWPFQQLTNYTIMELKPKVCLDNGTTIIRTGQFSYWKDQTWVAEVEKHSLQ